ncbi:MAG TPA: murein biosynthesis integral membrane protein MurJ [Chloroflexota bacterium]|nr:murein biosynthesis integral membrane protein MurJ [Chloroflexota bacterium]
MTSVTAPTRSRSAGARIAGAATILLSGFALSRLTGLLRDMVLTAQFGASRELDLYIAAFRIPDTVFALVAGGALGSTLVPVFAERLQKGDRAGAGRLASTVFNLVALAAIVAAAAGMLLADEIAPLFGAGFEPAEQARLALLIRILLIQPVLLSMSEVVSRFLNVHQHFFYPALAPALYNVPIILAALALGPRFGSVGLVMGVVLGAVLYFVVQLPAGIKAGFRVRRTLDVKDPALRQIGQLMVPRMVGQGAVQFSFILTTYLATYLPEGRLVALSVAWVLTMLPLGPLGMAIGNAALPTMSAQAARGARDELGKTAGRTLSAILFLIAPATVLLIIVGLPIVRTLYERGNFTLESSAQTATALAFYAAGLPAHGAIEILTRAFFALQNTRTPVVVAVLAMVTNVVLAYSLVGTLGYLAIALALTASTIIEAAVLWLLLRREVPRVASPTVFFSLARTALATVAMGGALVPALALARSGELHPLFQVIASLAAGGAVYLAVARLTRSPELSSIVSLIQSRFRR